MTNSTNGDTNPPQTAPIPLKTHALSLAHSDNPTNQSSSSSKQHQRTPRFDPRPLNPRANIRIRQIRLRVQRCDPTAENLAAELEELLMKAGIRPPYLLVRHSYGVTIARKFVHRRGGSDDVVGIVFVDAKTEATAATFPSFAVQAMQRGLNSRR